ncbi:MAG: ArnT family glycosyltransferase [Candidatus Hodarchaeota archaeon]
MNVLTDLLAKIYKRPEENKKFKVEKESLSVIIVVLFAILIRLILMHFRANFLEYDEAYYIILAKNLSIGKGYILNGLPHVNNFPLFPIMIGLFSFVISDLIWSSRIITAIAGGTVLIPIYYLIKGISQKKVAITVILFMSVMPCLISFANFSTKYIDRIYFGAEHLFMLLLYLAIYFAWLSYKKDRVIFYIATGLFLGLAYLARFEAILYFMAILLFLILNRIIFQKLSSLRKMIAGLLGIIISFIIIVAPLFIYLYKTTGHFTISGKAEVSSHLRDGVYAVLKYNDWSKFCQTLYDLDESDERMKSILWGVEKENIVTNNRENMFSSLLKESLSLTPFNLCFFLTDSLKVILPLFLWPFFIIGVYSVIRDFSKWQDELFILSVTFLPTLAIAFLSFPLPKYCLILVPLFSYYIARSVFFLCENINGKGKRRIFNIIIISELFMFLMTLTFKDISILILKNARPLSFHVAELNNKMALELKQRIPTGATIMSTHPSLALFSGGDWRVLPIAPFDKIIHYALFKKIDYIVFSRLGGYKPPSVRIFFAENNRYNFFILHLSGTHKSFDDYQKEYEGHDYIIFK